MRAFLLHSGEPSLGGLLQRLRLPHGTALPEDGASDGGRYVVHWGGYHPDRGHAGVLQPVKSILLAGSLRRAAEELALHGISTALAERPLSPGAEEGRASAALGPDRPGGGSRWSHDFMVPVFHLRALALFHRAHGVFYGGGPPPGSPASQGSGDGSLPEISMEQPSYYAARAMREAVKAIYALGLDYGVVRIGVRPGGELVVRAVEAVPQLTPRLSELFAEAMNAWAEELASREGRPPREVMLGADPEFLLLTPRDKVKFASVFTGREGPFGCDAIVLPSRRKVFPLAELRPQPSCSVRELLVHLHRTMQLAARCITDPELRWVAGGMPVRGFPLGGHIHFSGVELDCRLLRALDNYLALPLTLVEGESTGQRKPQYGFLGDFRRQRHGGFEYRVLPSWMVSPVVARGVLSLAKLIAQHYPLLEQRPLAEPDVTRAYYRGDKARIRPLLGPLWRDVERLPGYAEHEAYLMPLRRMMMQMRAWDERGDIRPRWKILPRVPSTSVL